MIIGVLGGLACALLILVWWLLFSRVPWRDRIVAIALVLGLALITRFLIHPSIAGGMMGMMYPIFVLPFLMLALVVWAWLSRRTTGAPRWAMLAGLVAIACGFVLALRTDGIKGEGGMQLAWRWTKTAEERLVEKVPVSALPVAAATPVETRETSVASEPTPVVEPKPPAAKTVAVAEPVQRAEWPGFRGPARDGVVHGVRIETNWAQTPPVQVWKRDVGPGWSSFAVRGDVFYTQEQRGDAEIVACYKLANGEPVWAHKDSTRFYESNGGPGPRSTPTVSGNRVFTFGATGIVNALEARTGALIWQKNAATDTGAKTPEWGFSSSPLVVGDLVIIAASGRLAAYDAAKGALRWTMATGKGSYSSPHLAEFDGVRQVVLLSGVGATSVSPADGKVLWKHDWDAVFITQPAVLPDGLLIAGADASGGLGVRRLLIAKQGDVWKVEEQWTSKGLKPYYNDLVIHNGYAYGFDGAILSCIDLKDGSRKWKGGRYGHGQMVLLADQGVLVVMSEEGELALVSADPAQFQELGRVPAINGKTWNHPVVANGLVLVRNGEQMAAFRLPGSSS
jgi:outer membrane protein assembly factor BamB